MDLLLTLTIFFKIIIIASNSLNSQKSNSFSQKEYQQHNMQAKLRSFISKENDIENYEKSCKKKLIKQLQPHIKNINYSETKFFANCEEFLQNIKQEAKLEQKLIEHKRKLKAMQQKEKRQMKEINQQKKMLEINLLIDYLKAQNMNYCYSMVMRQKNLVSEDMVTRGDLADLLGLKDEFMSDQRLNVSVLELILEKFNHLTSLISQKKELSHQTSVQCQLIHCDSQNNNMLLTQIKLQEIRKQTQTRERKHYQSQIHLFKSQELLKLKEDMKKLYEIKEGKLVQQYEEKLKDIARTQGNEGFERSTRQVEEYLSEIEKLKKQVRSLKDYTTNLEKISLEHDCLKQERLTNQLQQIAKQRKQLETRKQDFQLALRNLTTNVEDMALQKNRLLSDNRKETEEFLAKVKSHKENKDYMIDKVYGMLRGFQMRIENLSQDNAKIYQENETLRRQLDGFKKMENLANGRNSARKYLDGTKNISGFSELHPETIKTLNLTELKIPTKNALIGATPEDISAETQAQMQQSEISSQESVFTYKTEEYEQKRREKTEQTEKINRLRMEMGLLKNKVRWMVTDFEN